MTVQAKFYVNQVEKPEGTSTAAKVSMGPVCRGIENAHWASSTPSGNITLGILNDNATAYFEQGAEYLITFERVYPPKPNDGHRVDVVRAKHGYLLCGVCGHYPAGQGGPNQAPDTVDWAMHEEFFAAK